MLSAFAAHVEIVPRLAKAHLLAFLEFLSGSGLAERWPQIALLPALRALRHSRRFQLRDICPNRMIDIR
jgi:hypothetical protein